MILDNLVPFRFQTVNLDFGQVRMQQLNLGQVSQILDKLDTFQTRQLDFEQVRYILDKIVGFWTGQIHSRQDSWILDKLDTFQTRQLDFGQVRYILDKIVGFWTGQIHSKPKMVQQQKIGHQEFIRIVCTLCTLVYDVIGCSIGFEFRQSTLKLQLSTKLIIVGAMVGN